MLVYEDDHTPDGGELVVEVAGVLRRHVRMSLRAAGGERPENEDAFLSLPVPPEQVGHPENWYLSTFTGTIYPWR